MVVILLFFQLVIIPFTYPLLHCPLFFAISMDFLNRFDNREMTCPYSNRRRGLQRSLQSVSVAIRDQRPAPLADALGNFGGRGEY